MNLADLDPRWVRGAGAVEERRGMGISFKCPCCLDTPKATRLVVFFANPLDGMAPAQDEKTWQREGTTFVDLTLSPSIDVSKEGHWHGFIKNGTVA